MATLAASSGLQDAFDPKVAEALGVQHITYYRMLSEVNHAPEECKTLLVGSANKVRTLIQAATESLESRIPNYQPYVTYVYDPDAIKNHLLDKSWDDFATAWVSLSKCFAIGKALSHSFYGDVEFKFEQAHANQCAVLGQAKLSTYRFLALSTGRNFL